MWDGTAGVKYLNIYQSSATNTGISLSKIEYYGKSEKSHWLIDLGFLIDVSAKFSKCF